MVCACALDNVHSFLKNLPLAKRSVDLVDTAYIRYVTLVAPISLNYIIVEVLLLSSFGAHPS